MSRPRPVPHGAALVVLGPGGFETASRLRPHLPGAVVHGLGRRVEGADVAFEDTAAHLRGLFAAGVPIVGLCAAGILIRALAPALGDKDKGSPVVAVAEDGAAAVPLLGGHRGANALARAVADAVCGVAAVTTAGDVRLGLALDEPPSGWQVANPEAAGPVAAALLAGEAVVLRADAGDVGWLTDSAARFATDGASTIHVTDERGAGDARTLVLHPPSLALGVGCERGTEADELARLVEDTLAGHGLARASVACVVSLDLKADEPAVLALADGLGVPARFFDAAALEAERPRLATPSAAVFRETGCHGVAEGAALAAVGAPGRLIVPKAKSKRATCAVARAAGDIDPGAVGRAAGTLTVIGIGPGPAAWRSAAADAALAAATEVVGYRLYLDLLGPVLTGKACHASEIGQEEARVRHALTRAAEGRTVALVSSGDAGIYALAALVFELLDREENPAWRAVRIEVTPGITAMQAAAARAGAPLGHDFCAISLSDLLTPWPEIACRLAAAADGDFVVCLYNPASRQRRAHLAAACDILGAKRPPDTPVVVARNLGRAGEEVHLTTLAAFDPAAVDMLSIVIVGSRRTRVTDHGGRRHVYTPRGYRV